MGLVAESVNSRSARGVLPRGDYIHIGLTYRLGVNTGGRGLATVTIPLW